MITESRSIFYVFFAGNESHLAPGRDFRKLLTVAKDGEAEAARREGRARGPEKDICSTNTALRPGRVEKEAAQRVGGF